MIIVRREGCTNRNITVDGVSLHETDENVFVDYLCDKLKREYREGRSSIDYILDCFQPVDTDCSDEACDQCGDYTYTTTWEI